MESILRTDGALDTQFFGLAVDALGTGALIVDGVVERPIPIALFRQIFGENACHPFASREAQALSAAKDLARRRERSAGCAQDDREDLSPVRSREVFSPNVWEGFF